MSVCQLVCHNILKGWEVPLPCPYQSSIYSMITLKNLEAKLAVNPPTSRLISAELGIKLSNNNFAHWPRKKLSFKKKRIKELYRPRYQKGLRENASINHADHSFKEILRKNTKESDVDNNIEKVLGKNASNCIMKKVKKIKSTNPVTY